MTGSAPWPPRAGRARVLVEAADGPWRRQVEERLTARGHDVVVCDGAGSDHSCPVLDGSRCPVSAHADVVVCDLGSGVGREAETWALPLAVARELPAGASVIALLPANADHPGAEAPARCRHLRHPIAVADLVTAVDEAIGELIDTPLPRSLRPRNRPLPPGPLLLTDEADP
jgi:hypothetical protein